MGCFELLSDFVGDALWPDGYGKGHGCRKSKLNTCKFGLTQEGAARFGLHKKWSSSCRPGLSSGLPLHMRLIRRVRTKNRYFLLPLAKSVKPYTKIYVGTGAALVALSFLLFPYVEFMRQA